MRVVILSTIAAAGALAACHSPPPALPPVAVVSPSPAQWGQGIDLPTDASDVLNELKGSRVDFVARYYRNPASRWPALTASEAQRLSSLGLAIVAVWEGHSRDPRHFSYFSGYQDALIAQEQAKAIGQPPGTAIYFAVDFDAQLSSLAAVDEYFRGIAASLAAGNGGNIDYKVGVYGSGAVCDTIKRNGLAQYCWLSNSIAWSGSIDYRDWDIRQGTQLPQLSFNHDADEARADYGGFRVAVYDPTPSRQVAMRQRDYAPLVAQDRHLFTSVIAP